MEIEQINKYVGSKIKDYRKAFGLSQEELAKKIGVGKTTISNYEVGFRSPKKPQMIKLSEVFGITIDDFFPQTDSKKINVSTTLSEINKISSQLEEPRQKIVLDTANVQLEEQNTGNVIELKEYTYTYFDNPISAGTGEYLTDGRQETVTLPVEFDADFVAPVNGDSMEPEYHHCDYVFVETTYDLSDGDIGVFILDGEAYIKQLLIDDEGAFLHSLNPKYRDKPILTESDFRIIGKVIGRYSDED
ncbi:XRE family transcriptional regulator [Lactococcus lactis]|nr:XRE family transcriptional regulator [Lactococcus lactis]